MKEKQKGEDQQREDKCHTVAHDCEQGANVFSMQLSVTHAMFISRLL